LMDMFLSPSRYCVRATLLCATILKHAPDYYRTSRSPRSKFTLT
jgi:hypothetical protein